MTDHTDPPMDDASDEMPAEQRTELRARLQVEPLDEITRARLVRNALVAAPAEDAAEQRHRPVRWLAAAAAIVAVVAVGVGVLTHDSDAPQTTASAPAAKSTVEPENSQEFSTDSGARSSGSATAAPSAPALDAPVAIPSLGKLGEVGREAQLRADRPKTATASRGDSRPRVQSPTSAPAGC